MTLRSANLAIVFLLVSLTLAACDSSSVPVQETCSGAPASEPVGSWESLGLNDADIDDITAIAVHPSDPQVLYAGSSFNFSDGIQGKLFRSTNAGVTWDTLLVGGSYRDIQFAPSDPSVLYALRGGIIKSTDGGQTWTDISERFSGVVASLAIHPEDANVLFVGTSGSFGGTLYRSVDGGETWQDIGEGTSLVNGVTSLALHPANPEIIFAGTAWSGVIMKSTDGGDTWGLMISTSHLVHDLLISPDDHQVLAGFSDLGILRSNDGGQTWASDNEGLPDTTRHVTKIKIGEACDTYVIASWQDSGGIYRRTLGEGSWTQIGIPGVNQSYYYSNLEWVSSENHLYVGIDGVYRLTFD